MNKGIVAAQHGTKCHSYFEEQLRRNSDPIHMRGHWRKLKTESERSPHPHAAPLAGRMFYDYVCRIESESSGGRHWPEMTLPSGKRPDHVFREDRGGRLHIFEFKTGWGFDWHGGSQLLRYSEELFKHPDLKSQKSMVLHSVNGHHAMLEVNFVAANRYTTYREFLDGCWGFFVPDRPACWEPGRPELQKVCSVTFDELRGYVAIYHKGDTSWDLGSSGRALDCIRVARAQALQFSEE